MYLVLSFYFFYIPCCCSPSTHPIHSIVLPHPLHNSVVGSTLVQVVHQNMEVASIGVPSFCLSLCIRTNLFLPPIYIQGLTNVHCKQRTNQDASSNWLVHSEHKVLVLENGDISQGSKWVNQENQSQAASRIAPNTCETFNK